MRDVRVSHPFGKSFANLPIPMYCTPTAKNEKRSTQRKKSHKFFQSEESQNGS